jgi:CheY-like chemotaxis protein
VVALLCNQPGPGDPAGASRSPAPGPAEQSVPAPATKPGLLVVDDEPLVRGVLIAWLQSGFTVWPAASGMEALDLYEAHQKEIAVVLLDVRMPVLDGPGTLSALRRLDPAVRCCFMTGDVGGYTEAELLALGAVHLFPKPFDLQEMAEVLRQLTSGQGPTDATAFGAGLPTPPLPSGS